MDGVCRRSFAAPAVAFAVGLTARLVFLAELSGSGLLKALVGDAEHFHEWAVEIARGDWLGSTVFYQAPLYPYFAGTVYALFGEDPTLLRVVQAFLGAGSCALAAVAASRLLSRPAGWCAGLLLALSPTAIWLDGLVQKAGLALFLGCALVAVAAGARRPGAARGFALGTLLGLLTLTRENAAVLLPVLVGWLVLGFPEAGARPRWQAAGALAVGFVLVLLPVALRNQHVGGAPLPTAANAGVNLYIGNGAGADGLYRPLVPGRGHPDFERADARRLAEREAGHPLGPAAVSRHWAAKTVDEVRADPPRWLRLLGRKALLVANRREIMDAEAIETHRRSSLLLDVLAHFLHLGVLLPLCALGAVANRREGGRLLFLHAAWIALGASVVLFFVTARFRFGLVPFLLPFAGAGAVELGALLRAGRAVQRSRALRAGAVLLGAGLACNLPLELTGDPHATTATNVAVELWERGRFEDAEDWAIEAVRAAPGSAGAHLALGLARGGRGNADGAERSLRRAVELEPERTADAYEALGRMRAPRGEHSAAVLAYRRSLAARPEQIAVRQQLAGALVALGRDEEAVRELELVLERNPDHPHALALLGGLRARAGEHREAIRLHERALEGDPRLVRSLRGLAWIRATHPDAELRDGALAVRLAERARGLERQPQPQTLDVLAAAYAELERFDDAVAAADEAAALAEDRGLEPLRRAVGERRALYVSRRPFREPPPADEDP